MRTPETRQAWLSRLNHFFERTLGVRPPDPLAVKVTSKPETTRERRRVLAAVSAAIAMPASGWVKADNGTPYWRAGLTEEQAAVRLALHKRLVEQVEELCTDAGAPAFVDMWSLSEALHEYRFADNNGNFCALVNCLQMVVGNNERFVAVPAELLEEALYTIEMLKEKPGWLALPVPAELATQVAEYSEQLQKAATSVQ